MWLQGGAMIGGIDGILLEEDGGSVSLKRLQGLHERMAGWHGGFLDWGMASLFLALIGWSCGARLIVWPQVYREKFIRSEF
jgi:hypothetical protein